MVIYVFGIIVMEHVKRRLKQTHKYEEKNTYVLIKKIIFKISSILWSIDYKQIVTGQGHPNNFIHIWHYPSMEKCHTLHGKRKDFYMIFIIEIFIFRSYITYFIVDNGSKRQSSGESISWWDNSILEWFSCWCSTKEKTWNDTYTFLSNET